MSASRRSSRVASSQPARWKAAGRASAPVPTIRLKIKMAAIGVDILRAPPPSLSGDSAIFVWFKSQYHRKSTVRNSTGGFIAPESYGRFFKTRLMFHRVELQDVILKIWNVLCYPFLLDHMRV